MLLVNGYIIVATLAKNFVSDTNIESEQKHSPRTW